jgi:hypothetical protein
MRTFARPSPTASAWSGSGGSQDPWCNGTTALLFERKALPERHAALIPRPEIYLTPYHGDPAPNARPRAGAPPVTKGADSYSIQYSPSS